MAKQADRAAAKAGDQGRFYICVDYPDASPGFVYDTEPGRNWDIVWMMDCQEKEALDFAAALGEECETLEPQLAIWISLSSDCPRPKQLKLEGRLFERWEVLRGAGFAKAREHRGQLLTLDMTAAAIVMYAGAGGDGTWPPRLGAARPQAEAGVVQPSPQAKPATGKGDRGLLSARWQAEAMVLVRDHPDWPDARIARVVGVSPSTLSRSETYRTAAVFARSRRPPPKGTKDRQGNVEATTEGDESDAKES